MAERRSNPRIYPVDRFNQYYNFGQLNIAFSEISNQ